MDASPLHAGTVAGGGRIVDGKWQGTLAGPTHQRLEYGTEQTLAERLGTTAGSPQSGVAAAEVGADAGGSEPRGHGASPFGKGAPSKSRHDPKGERASKAVPSSQRKPTS
jgi:hypothetical protein